MDTDKLSHIVTPDITIHDHGSIILPRAASLVGKAWTEEYVDRDGYQPVPGRPPSPRSVVGRAVFNACARDVPTARQILKKILAGRILIRPVGPGVWRFAGISPVRWGPAGRPGARGTG
jgi:hypothetical protein